MKRSSLFFLGLMTLAFAAVITFGGCAAFRNPDGTINVEKTQQAAQAGAAAATSFGSIFGPLGIAIGSGVGTVLLAYAGKLTHNLGVAKGKEIGYDQGSLDAGKPLPSSTALPKG